MDPDTDIESTNEGELAVVSSKENGLARYGEKQLYDYEVGDQIKGDTIAHIYFASNSFLIFKSDLGSVKYVILRASQKIRQILAEFDTCGREYKRQLRGTYRSDFSNLIASCLNSALLSDDDSEDDVKAHFEPVASFLEERGPIEYVYGYDPNFIIYLNKRGVVSYECQQIPSRLIPAIEEFHRLQHIARSALQGADKQEVASILGTDLLTVFRTPEDADPSLFFFSSKDFITNRSEAILRSKYIRSSVLSSLVGLLVLIPSLYLLKHYSMESWVVLLGCIGGVIGATISIIQRGVALTVNPFVPISHVVFQGIVRVILGVVFGALLITAAKANIALGILSDNIWSLFIFSVVAGFSERFIPDILDRIAIQSSVADRK